MPTKSVIVPKKPGQPTAARRSARATKSFASQPASASATTKKHAGSTAIAAGGATSAKAVKAPKLKASSTAEHVAKANKALQKAWGYIAKREG